MSIGFTVAGEPDPPLRRLPAARTKPFAQGRGGQLDRAVDPATLTSRTTSRSPAGARHLFACAPVRSNTQLIGLLVIDAGGIGR